MFLYRLDYRYATPIRLAGLALVVWSVVGSSHHLGGSGRGLVITLLLALAGAAWLFWTLWPRGRGRFKPELYLLAGAGAVLLGAAPNSAASAFVFVAVAAAAVRQPLREAIGVLAVGVLALAIATLVYDNNGLGLLAYVLGFTATMFGGANARGSLVRAEQAELLLAEGQRSHEEQVRVARLEEQARIAREIHDVLAHALAGLAIQLEATASLIEQGADRDALLERVRRAHELARDGLRETRRAVGALRGDAVSVAEQLQALVGVYQTDGEGSVRLMLEGDMGRLEGPVGEAVLRVVQESLTNVRKHARGSDVSVSLHAGREPGEDVVLVVANQNAFSVPGGGPGGLAGTGGGLGSGGCASGLSYSAAPCLPAPAVPGGRLSCVCRRPGSSSLECPGSGACRRRPGPGPGGADDAASERARDRARGGSLRR